MHIWTNLLLREGALLAVLAALGAGPVAFLSERIDAASRLALAPILGFALGTCFALTVLQFAPADNTYGLLVLLALSSLALAAWRMSRMRGSWRAGGRLSLRDIAQLLLVVVAVTGPLNYVLHARHTVGPVAYYFTDVDGYVSEQDGAQTTSIHDARDVWAGVQRNSTRLADFTQYYWAFVASFNANPNMAGVAADVDSLLGLGATDTNSPFLIVLLLAGALGAFAAVRYATRSDTWMAPLAGALFGGPMFLELWFDSFEAAIMALGLIMPFAILGSESLRSPNKVNLALLALITACLLTVYPVYVPILALTSAIVLAWYVYKLRLDRGSFQGLWRPGAVRITTLVVFLLLFTNIGFIHDVEYYQKIAENAVPLPRVGFHLPLEVLPGWVTQTREFWYMPNLATGGLKQFLLGALLPFIFLGFAVLGLRRHRPALTLVALAGVCGLVAVYAYSSRDSCTYCAERDLLPLAPIAAVLIALGLATLLAMPRRWARVLGVIGAVLVALSVAQRTRVELTRFANNSYFLDSANRSVLAHLPGAVTAIELEGYGQTLSAQAEQPLVYHLADEHLRGRVSIVLGSDLNNALQYLNFGVVQPPGPEFHPNYDYVLTRFAGIETDRTMVARSGGIALEQRTRPLDVTPYSGLESPLARLNAAGTAWVQPGQPLQFYIVGSGVPRVWLKLSFHGSVPVTVMPQAGLLARQRGGALVVCVKVNGTSPIRSASVQIDGPLVAGSTPAEEFPPPVPPEGVALTAMHVVLGHCSV
jgi:hypothetical protein